MTPTNREQEKDGGSGLEPCPFCGKAPRPPEYYFMGSYWHMGCYDESHPVIEFRAYVPNPDNADDKAARYVAIIASWNTRRYQAQAPAIEAVVEEACRVRRDAFFSEGDITTVEDAYVEGYRDAEDEVVGRIRDALSAVRGGSRG